MNNEMKQLHVLKVIFLGNPRVGKTSLNRNFLGQGFSEEYMSTMGIDITKYHYTQDDQKYIVVFWDVGWQEKFMVVRQSVYLGTSGVILVFDLSQPLNAAENLEKWIIEFSRTHKGQRIPFAILGNKLDLSEDREVTYDQGKSSEVIVRKHFSDDIPVRYFETSAKTGEGVTDAINWLIKAIIQTNQ